MEEKRIVVNVRLDAKMTEQIMAVKERIGAQTTQTAVRFIINDWLKNNHK